MITRWPRCSWCRCWLLMFSRFWTSWPRSSRALPPAAVLLPRAALLWAAHWGSWGIFVRWLLASLVGVLALVGVQPLAAQAEPVAQAVDEGTTFVPMAPLRVLDTRN